MKIVIMNGSPRVNGNTAAMVEAFARGAKEAGHQVETVVVGTMKINGCKSCDWCHGAGKGATDCGIITSDDSTNKTEAKLNECYELGRSLK